MNSPVPPLPPDTDPALAALIMRMLAKEPSTRPGDAGRLARELDQLASAYGAPPSEPSPVVGVGVSPEPEVIASGVTTDQKPDHVEPIAVGVTQAPRKPRQAGHLPAIAGQIAVSNLPDSPAIPQMRVVARRSDEPDSQPQVVQPAPQPPPKPDRTSDITARRAALAVLIGIFAILGLLLVMQAIRGRAADPVQIVETTDAGSVESMSWNSERLSHGG